MEKGEEKEPELPYTGVEIIEAYELSYEQWGIFLFTCAFLRKVSTTFDKLVSTLKHQIFEKFASTYQSTTQSCTSSL